MRSHEVLWTGPRVLVPVDRYLRHASVTINENVTRKASVWAGTWLLNVTGGISSIPGTDQGRAMAEALRTGQSESGPVVATLPYGKDWAILEVSPPHRAGGRGYIRPRCERDVGEQGSRAQREVCPSVGKGGALQLGCAGQEGRVTPHSSPMFQPLDISAKVRAGSQASCLGYPKTSSSPSAEGGREPHWTVPSGVLGVSLEMTFHWLQ